MTRVPLFTLQLVVGLSSLVALSGCPKTNGGAPREGNASGKGGQSGASPTAEKRQRREKAAEAAQVVVAYTSVDQVFSEPVFRAFEKTSGIKVKAVFDTEETKSTGVLNRLLAEAKRPRADVFWSGDPIRPLILIKRGLVEPYASKVAASIPSAFRAADHSWTGFAARARVLLVNTKLVSAVNTPTTLTALVDPRWRGKAAIANPLFGTTTMHAAALFAAWGDQRAKAFFAKLKANEVRIASSNGEVKRLVSSGELAFGLTDTDDAFTALKAGAPVRIVYPDQGMNGRRTKDSSPPLGALVMPTAVVKLKASPNGEAGRKLIDFLLGAKVERMMAERAAHMPMRAGIPTPKGIKGVAAIKAMPCDYGKLAATMERIQPWLRTWVGL
ncbi:MAG: iron ABC transporter substrate-binding protein [Proteobacteria bacterium]|nr:MAG: iron ABC transporter substrate-binding protein [Pseudomonadota bacterium]